MLPNVLNNFSSAHEELFIKENKPPAGIGRTRAERDSQKSHLITRKSRE